MHDPGIVVVCCGHGVIMIREYFSSGWWTVSIIYFYAISNTQNSIWCRFQCSANSFHPMDKQIGSITIIVEARKINHYVFTFTLFTLTNCYFINSIDLTRDYEKENIFKRSLCIRSSFPKVKGAKSKLFRTWKTK